MRLSFNHSFTVSQEGDAVTGGPMRILLIEDDPVVAQSIELMLSTGPFEVETTSLGGDGVDIGKLDRHDLILLDLNLPDMSGYDVLRVLRVAKVKTPILILSGLATIENKVKGLGFGADDYLTKPFNKDELVARIRRSASFGSRCGAGSPVRRLYYQAAAETRAGGGHSGAPDHKGVPAAGAIGSASREHDNEGNDPQPDVRRHGRAGAEDHRRVHLQAPQKARRGFRRKELYRDRLGSGVRAS